ncbi:glycoside hydrolase family 43 protein [Lacrimispora aerotolerans]|uniref:glycoside hydrolase family 43 protein n=1 Tax=Lacrimispora aerotolerans TaxID=36832 RepID=UPI0009FDFD5D|nr:glycoside hydrolase family 43 protein [Lacrimispora aerotolerans]
MKKVCKVVVSLLAISLFLSTECYADNPIVQTNYTADPAPMVYNGTCYLYTSHDEDTTVNNFYTMNDWRCYSSTDMQNWTDHGSPLSYNTFSWAQGDAWAGQVINRNGKFYFYGPMTRKNAGGARVIGVAVSDSPTGPFTDPIGKPLIANNGAQDIDPTVFIDDNGQAYLYWGNGNLYYVKLNQDMISYSGGIVQVSPKPANFIEGPWFYKRNNLYYMVYAGMTGGSENISYATSNSPTGPWTSKGTIMGSQNSYTNHPGVIDYKGNSYLFYHTGSLPGGGSYHRSVGVEQFKYNADGTIPSIPITKNGPGQLSNLDPYVKTEAETICWESGVETEKCSEGGMDVCNIENGDWIKVKGVDFGSGAASFEARVASATNGGNIEIRLDSETGKLVGTCAVSSTGGWQTWTTKTCNVSGATGVHDLYLKFTGGSGFLFNINWWKFTGTGVTPTPGETSAFSQIEAESYNNQSGIQTESCSEGGEDVGYIENGDYVVYKNIDFGNGAERFKARVASSSSGGNIEIRLDSLTGPLVGTCRVTGTGGWQTWADAMCSVNGVSGKHDLYLKFTGGSGYLFNLNWFKFTGGGVTAGDIKEDMSVGEQTMP